MALPANDKIIGDLGHTADHNAIVDEITFIKENYLSASGGSLDDYLRQDTASALYATISSPEFTGVPLAPTAASGTNTTQIATTEFVRTEISNLIGDAPELLDTLNELAAAINDDENFFTTVTNSLSSKLDAGTASTIYLTQSDASDLYFPKSASGGLLTEQEASELYLPLSASGGLLTESEAAELYLPISASSNLSPEGYLTSSAAAALYAPLDSPNLTGVPTAPTASAGSSDTQLATTEFVSLAVAQAQSGSVDLSAYLTKSSASAIYLTQESASATYLPISASANFGGSGSVDLSDYLTLSVASATYLTITDAENTYLPISASSAFAGVALAVMSPTEPEDPLNGTIWVDTDSEVLPYSSSAVDLSEYLTKASASALYLSSTDAVIDCGGP
jgi:hypothetical protein